MTCVKPRSLVACQLDRQNASAPGARSPVFMWRGPGRMSPRPASVMAIWSWTSAPLAGFRSRDVAATAFLAWSLPLRLSSSGPRREASTPNRGKSGRSPHVAALHNIRPGPLTVTRAAIGHTRRKSLITARGAAVMHESPGRSRGCRCRTGRGVRLLACVAVSHPCGPSAEMVGDCRAIQPGCRGGCRWRRERCGFRPGHPADARRGGGGGPGGLGGGQASSSWTAAFRLASASR